MKKRTQEIQIAFVAAVAAAALTGCDADKAYQAEKAAQSGQGYSRDWEQCVDKDNRVVEERLCDQKPSGGTTGAGIMPGGYYHWLYAPRLFAPGSIMTGGYGAPIASSVTRASGGPATARPATTRSGFGSSALFNAIGA